VRCRRVNKAWKPFINNNLKLNIHAAARIDKVESLKRLIASGAILNAKLLYVNWRGLDVFCMSI